MPDKIMLLPSDAPAPLEIYETPKTHPDNQRLIDERLARFRPLDKKERKRLERRRKDLWKRLNQGYTPAPPPGLIARLKRFLRPAKTISYNQLHEQRHHVNQQFSAGREEYQKLHGELTAADEATRAAGLPKLKELRAQIRRLAEDGKRLNGALSDLEPIHQEYVEVNQRLLDHEKILKEDAEERWQQKKFFREAKIIEGLMISTFARTKGCHHVWSDSRGRRIVETPKFQQSGSNADSHWFLLQTTIKERFGHRDVLPYTVDVSELVSERVTENLSVALGFQVEVRRSADLTKIYYRVNRLDSPDGLPQYFAYPTMFQFYPERQHDLLPFPLGVFDNRRVKWSNLKDDPHILIAGKSKHGKSNYLNSLIATWIQFHSPEEIRFLLCDFKGGVEFTVWRNIPHLLGDFVKAQRDLLPRLREVRRLIDARLALMEKSGTTDLASYNRSVNADQRLPQIVVVIDELQDLVGKGKWTRKVHHLLSVIGSLGRAPGITLILSTQFPNKEVVPMSVKANMSLLVMFLMPAYAAQTLMMDTSASKLAPRVIGRALAVSGNEQDQMQTAYISPDDKASGARFAIKTYSPSPWYIDMALPIAPPVIPSGSATAASAPPPALPAQADDDDEDDVKLVKVGLSEEDLITLAVDLFDSNLKVRLIYKLLKNKMQTSEKEIAQLVKRLVDKGKIEHGGVTYLVLRKPGNFYGLVPVEVKPESSVAAVSPVATEEATPPVSTALTEHLLETA